MASNVETLIRSAVTKGIGKVADFNRKRLPRPADAHPYLTGIHQPMTEELTLEALRVDGEIPAALSGRYLRNGPNPALPPDPASYHWFTGAGMVHGIRIETWSEKPFAVVEGIEFRSVTVTAHKGKQGPCYETNQAVVYRGPWRRVEDDDGHALVRGERTAVCEKTFRLLTGEPYAQEIIPVPSRIAVADPAEHPFDCARPHLRDPRETKGEAYRATEAPACGPGESCC